MTLYDMDDLQRTVARNLDVQEAEASARAHGHRGGAQRFDRWLSTLDVVPTIAALRERGEEVVRAGPARERGPLGVAVGGGPRAGRADGARGREPPAARADDSAQALTEDEDSAYVHLQALRELFGLDDRRPLGRGRGRGHVARRAPRGAGQARLSGSGEARDAGQRAGARAGAARGRPAGSTRSSWSSSRPPATAECRGGDKSRWVKEIEEALLDGRADLAVHSAKDVPGELPEGLSIVGVPERADARDRSAARRASRRCRRARSSARAACGRRSQLLAVRPDLDVEDMRGNVDTRLRKLRERPVRRDRPGAAGLDRLGRGRGRAGGRRRR